MNNKLKSFYVCLFLFLSISCTGTKKEIIFLKPIAVISKSYYFSPWYSVLISDKTVYQLNETVSINLSMTYNIPMDGGGFGGSPSNFEFNTKEHVEWKFYIEEELIFNYPKIFHDVDSSNIILNRGRFKESFQWNQKDNDNKYVKTGEYKIVATILDIDHPSSAKTTIRIE